MHPIICQIGPFTVYSYGAMIAAAAILCSWLLSRDAKKERRDPDVFFDLVFWVVIAGVLGGRVFFVLLNLDYFQENPLEMFFIHHGGLAWQGALIFATLASIGFIHYKKLPLLRTLDFVIPYAALGQSLGRIGCFLNGCCQGREWVHGFYVPAHQAYLHPVQLYSALNLLVIFFVLKWYRSRNKIDGRVFAWYFILASGERFGIQFLRADYDPFFLGLGIFQIVALVIMGMAIYGNIFLLRRSRSRQ